MRSTSTTSRRNMARSCPSAAATWARTGPTLPRAEMVASLASLLAPEIAYPAQDFRAAWNEVLFYDEHSWGANNSTTQPGQRFGAEQIAFKEAHVARATEGAQDLLRLSFAR